MSLLRDLGEEFKEFVDRGNVVDLAVAVIIAGAFVPVVASLVDDVVMQIVARVLSQPDFGELTLDLGEGAVIRYGSFLNAVLTFGVIAFVVFLLIKGYNQMRYGAEFTKPTGPTEVELLAEIRDSLRSVADRQLVIDTRHPAQAQTPASAEAPTPKPARPAGGG